MRYKVIDADKKGNAIRLYCADITLQNWWGDDWDDVNCDDTVYSEFVDKYIDITLGYQHGVYSPFDFYDMTNYIKKVDIQDNKHPLLIIIPNESVFESHEYNAPYNYKDACGRKDAILIYMGDELEEIGEKLKAVK